MQEITLDDGTIIRLTNLEKPGIAPKEFMADPRVSIVSKAIFACICGFTDWGYTATPGSIHEFHAPQLSHMGIMKCLELDPMEYFSHLNKLGKYGYINETDEFGQSWTLALPKGRIVKRRRGVTASV